MPSEQARSSPAMSMFGLFTPAMEYMADAAQRSVLFWDVMRQRGNQYREHLAETAPHVLDYEVELVVDGRTLERPVNYALVRVVPPAGVEVDPLRRPFVIVDPRAGHGPGIARLAWLGAGFDPAANAAHATLISHPGSRLALYVIPTDEELMIARHTLALLSGGMHRRIAESA
jgi:hypothetical protein